MSMSPRTKEQLEQVLERRDAALKEWRTLSSRSKGADESALQRLQELNKLADDVAEEQARASEEEQRQRVVEVEQAVAAAEASVTELKGRLVEERTALRRLERETLKARRFDPAAKERVDALERQEAEQVAWHARHRSGRPQEWPPHLREQVAAEVERLRAEHAEAKARRAEESAANLAARGLTPQSAREALGIGRVWPRL
jgi:hypothetical protein